MLGWLYVSLMFYVYVAHIEIVRCPCGGSSLIVNAQFVDHGVTVRWTYLDSSLVVVNDSALVVLTIVR